MRPRRRLYGVLSYGVTQRRREIGLSIALGPSARTVVGMVGGRGLVMTAAGLGIGVPLAAVGTRAMTTMALWG
jgi:putative ABC transport system permease protein